MDIGSDCIIQENLIKMLLYATCKQNEIVSSSTDSAVETDDNQWKIP